MIHNRYNVNAAWQGHHWLAYVRRRYSSDRCWGNVLSGCKVGLYNRVRGSLANSCSLTLGGHTLLFD